MSVVWHPDLWPALSPASWHWSALILRVPGAVTTSDQAHSPRHSASRPGTRSDHQSHTGVFLAKLILKLLYIALLVCSRQQLWKWTFSGKAIITHFCQFWECIKYNPYKPFLNVSSGLIYPGPDCLWPPCSRRGGSLMKLRSSVFVSPLCWPVTAGGPGGPREGPAPRKNNSLVKIPTPARLSGYWISENIKSMTLWPPGGLVSDPIHPELQNQIHFPICRYLTTHLVFYEFVLTY